MKDESALLVIDAYREILDLQQVDFEKPEKIDKHTPVYGSNGYLDSLGLVNLVVAIEEKVKETFNVSISLATEKAMSRTRSPFRDVKSLSLYLNELLRDKINE